MLAANTITTYVAIYMTTYATNTLGMPPRVAFGATVATGFCGVCFNPLGGALSDRFGRKPVMLAGSLVLLLVTLPTVSW